MSTNHHDEPIDYAFGPFRLDLPSRQLYRGADALPLTGKAFDTLLLLVSRQGQLVEKDELLSYVWPDTHVTEDSLTQSISVLRRTLGEDAAQPRYIVTVPRRGYRFMAPVMVGAGEASGVSGAGRAGEVGRDSLFPPLSTPPAPPAPPALFASPWPWRTALLLGIPAAALLLVFLRSDAPRAIPNEQAIRFEHAAAPGTTLASGGVLSPDGRHLAFIARDNTDGRMRLWVRVLDASTSRALPGTEGAFRPFWSPDGQSIAFFAEGRLKKADLDGATPQTLATVGYRPSGGTWSRDGVLLYADRMSRIYSVSATGDGKVTPLTTLDSSRQEVAHNAPQFLPDGRNFLFGVTSGAAEFEGTYVASLDDPDARTRLLDGGVAAAVFAAPGYLVYVRDQTLMAQPFDTTRLRLSGSPAPLGISTASQFSISAAPGGLLTFGGDSAAEHMVWFDRAGKHLSVLPAARLRNPSLSPDERQLVGDDNGVWLVDLERGAPTRLAPGSLPSWGPNGTGVVFTRRNGNDAAIVLHSIAGEDEERVLVHGREMKLSADWTRDGRHFVYVASTPETRLDIWELPTTAADAAPRPFLASAFNEMQPHVSPDGRWIAYTSDESGSWEVYVQSFPAAGGKRAISVGGGAEARWTKEGREIVYLRPDGTMMAVDISPDGAALQPGRPRPLFRSSVAGDITTFRNHYVVSGDGQRFLMHTADESTRAPISVVVHWEALLNR